MAEPALKETRNHASSFHVATGSQLYLTRNFIKKESCMVLQYCTNLCGRASKATCWWWRWYKRLPKYSKNSGVFCHVTNDKISSFLLNRGSRLQETNMDDNYWTEIASSASREKILRDS